MTLRLLSIAARYSVILILAGGACAQIEFPPVRLDTVSPARASVHPVLVDTAATGFTCLWSSTQPSGYNYDPFARWAAWDGDSTGSCLSFESCLGFTHPCPPLTTVARTEDGSTARIFDYP